MEVVRVTRENVISYLDDIARIHAGSYSGDHFTSTFDAKKLKEYNRFLIDSADICIAAVEEDRVLGFAISGEDLSRGVKEFTRNNRVYLVYKLLTHPGFLGVKIRGKLASTTIRSGPAVTKYRLLSIATDVSVQSKGIGQLMLTALEEKLRSRGIDSYGLSVRSDNHRAVQFYGRNGFVIEKEQPGSLYFKKTLR